VAAGEPFRRRSANDPQTQARQPVPERLGYVNGKILI